MSDNSSYANAQLHCPGNPGQTYVGIDAPSANCSACFLKRRAHVGPDNRSCDAPVTAAASKGSLPSPKNMSSGSSSSRLKCPDKDTVYAHALLLPAPLFCFQPCFARVSTLFCCGVFTNASAAGTRAWMRPPPTARTVSKSVALTSSTLPFKHPMQLYHLPLLHSTPWTSLFQTRAHPLN